jgi:hypothetical protein
LFLHDCLRVKKELHEASIPSSRKTLSSAAHDCMRTFPDYISSRRRLLMLTRVCTQLVLCWCNAWTVWVVLTISRQEIS